MAYISCVTRLRVYVAVLMLSVLIECFAPSAFANDFSHLSLDFDGAIILHSERRFVGKSSSSRYFGLRSTEGRRFEFTVDSGTSYDVWLDHGQSQKKSTNDAALGIKINSNEDQNVKDKILFNFFRHRDREAIHVDDAGAAYKLSFRFKLDETYEVPAYWALHMQVWQCCGGPPPLSIRSSPGPDRLGPVQFTFNITQINNESGPRGIQKVLYKMPIERARWYDLKMELVPRSRDDLNGARIVAWLNEEFRFSYTGNWGYDARSGSLQSLKIGSIIQPYMGVGLGTYRRRQKTTQIIYFDDVKFERIPF